MESSQFLTCILIVATISSISCATLSLIECGANLPSPRAAMSAVFDGFDTIFLLGGYDGDGFSLNDTLKYSISLDQVSQWRPLPEGLHDGCGFLNGDGDLLYVGGYLSSSVYTTSVLNDSVPWSLLSTLPNTAGYVGCISRDPWSATLFGGWDTNKGILNLDLKTGDYTPNSDGLGAEMCTLANAVWNPSTQNATIFCSFASYMQGRVINYHQPSGGISPVEQPTNRSFYNAASAFDGVNAYIIGGWHSEGLPPWGDEIFMFNTVTQEGRRVDVDNLPSWDNTTFDLAAAVYVPHLNRIYVFGGRKGLFEYSDSIWYIDLEPVNPIVPLEPPNPDIFQCEGKPEGLYSHPVNCSMYILCGRDDMFVQQCPQPLLYDGAIKSCNLPEWIECEPSCKEKPEGFYRHPHDCALYIHCNGDGDEEIHVLKCPPPTLFDPILMTCNPDFVDCDL